MAWLGSFIRIVISSRRRSKLDLLDCYIADICFGGQRSLNKRPVSLDAETHKNAERETENTGHAHGFYWLF